MRTRSWSRALGIATIVVLAAGVGGQCRSRSDVYPIPVKPPIPPLRTTPSPYRPTPRPTRTPTPTPPPLPGAEAEPEP